MRLRRSSAEHRRRRARRHARLDALAVAVLAALTVLLWLVAVPAVHHALTRVAAADSVTAQVVECPQERVLAPPCQVSFVQQGTTVTRDLTQGTLFGPEPGEWIDVHAPDDGTVTIGGWRAFAEPALLLFLAVAHTSFTLRRWTRVEFGHGRGLQRPDGAKRTGRRQLPRAGQPATRPRGSRAHPAA